MNDKLQFVKNELLIMAWAGSVQYAKLYKENTDSNSKDVSKFREKVIKFITDNLMPYYSAGCTEEQHYKNIQRLIDYANDVDPGILRDLGYKYGVAQKLLNLALKYYWCLGLINAPPHCPVDRIIVSKTKYSDIINWTQITEKTEYQKVIEEIKILAGDSQLSIPAWELTVFNGR
ncbi:MAG: hypothetical protein ACLQBQ_11760 [Smithella sp.]